LPNEKELAEARRKVGYKKLKLEAETRNVRFDVEGMRLDLGGIAKGYAIDRAVEAMKNNGVIGGLVDIGGDIRCFGKADDKEHWVIGLQDPKDADEGSEAKSSMTLKLTDNSIATSGDYRRYVLVEGKKYGHIIDTKKGHSSQNLSSVTIIAPNALDADALATAVSVLGAEKGLQLIESLEGVEAILITPAPEYKLIKSKNADKYILQE
jgi:thiamine biosynthesis lipoprotein